MNSLLLDLYGHQAWADAEHWRAIGAHTGCPGGARKPYRAQPSEDGTPRTASRRPSTLPVQAFMG
jgi:hypothetical protein